MVKPLVVGTSSEEASQEHLSPAQVSAAQAELDRLAQQLDSSQRELDILKAENLWLRERLGLAQHQRFGASSEANRPTQDGLFDEAEATDLLALSAEAAEPDEQSIVRRVRKGRSDALVQVANLPVHEERLELPEAERQCSHCSHELHEMGEDVTSKLEVVPAHYFVRRIVRVKYACRHCATHEVARPPVAVPLPPLPFPGSMASASVVASIVTQKYEMGLPLYRQEQSLAGRGLELSRQTMANWTLRCSEMLTPLYSHMQRVLVQAPVLHADETRVQVLGEEERQAQSQSYMWVYCTPEGEQCKGEQSEVGRPLVLYDYQTTRSSRHPQTFLQGFAGYLQVDGYEAYEKMEEVARGDIILAGCWAHARRKFEEVIKALPKEARQKGATAAAATPAHVAREFCNRLYAIERELQGSSAAERHTARQERSAPVLAEFHTWLQQQGRTITPKSLLGVAVGYCLRQWPKLTAFLQDGRIALDNNRVERAIKPFVIGRKNWLFCNTPRGATGSAVIYSLVETAKANGLVVQSYLQFLLERLPEIQTLDEAALESLMPWQPAAQAQCARNKPHAK